MSDGDFEYAHEMFSMCVSKHPDNLQYVQVMMRNLRDAHPNQRRRYFWRSPDRRELDKTLNGCQWRAAIEIGIELLGSDPWDVSTLTRIAFACERLRFNEVELVYLKQALDADPKNIEVNRHCAASLTRMGQFDQAIACWHRIEEISPRSKEEAQDMVVHLSQQKLRYPNGAPSGLGESQSGLAEQVASGDIESINYEAGDEQRQSEAVDIVTRKQKLKRLVERDVTSISSQVMLIEYLIERRCFGEAEAALKVARESCSDSKMLFDIARRLNEMRSARVETAKRAKGRQSVTDAADFPWLESLLFAATATLVTQLIPGVSEYFFTHPRIVLIMLNIVVVVLLICWQFWPRSDI